VHEIVDEVVARLFQLADPAGDVPDLLPQLLPPLSANAFE
jgi:hypothetical protein